MAEDPEVRGGQHDSPWRVEPVTVFEMRNLSAMIIEDRNKTQARAPDGIVLCCILLRIGHVDILSDPLYVEGRKPRRDVIVVQYSFGNAYLFEVGIEHIDPATVKIGRQDVFLPMHAENGCSLIHGFAGFLLSLGIGKFNNRSGCIYSRIPALDR